MERLPLAGLWWYLPASVLLLFLGPVSQSPAAPRAYEADLRYERGAHALRSGDFEAALEDLARTVELVPDDADALGLYARALLLAEQPHEAVEVLEDLKHLEPSAADLDLLLGLARSRLGEWAVARDHLEAASRREIFADYQVNEVLLADVPNARVMHCMPAHRGEEVTDEVLDSPQSLVYDQAENRLHAQKAIMERVMAPRSDGR